MERNPEKEGSRPARDDRDHRSRGYRDQQESTLIEKGLLALERVPCPEQVAAPNESEQQSAPQAPRRDRPSTTDHAPAVVAAPCHCSEAGAHEERLGSRVGAVVETVGRRADVIQHQHECRGRHGTHAGHHSQGAYPPLFHDEEGDERPNQVVLLLDRQRPGMKKGGWRSGLHEIALIREHEVPVRKIEHGGEGVTADARHIDR